MPLILLRGVPETPAVWRPLIECLDRDDVITLQLPGFGTAHPVGFAPSKESYVEWLIEELERFRDIEPPIDVVGHDWGGALVVRAAMLRPELMRSWVSNSTAFVDPDFVWHDAAMKWQTLDVGEAFWSRQLASAPATRRRMFAVAGAPDDVASELAAALDGAMIESILSLYRSAVNIAQEWSLSTSEGLPSGLALVPLRDPYLSAASSFEGAQRLQAEIAELDLGHWWMLENPSRSAEVLQAFWQRLTMVAHSPEQSSELPVHGEVSG